MTEPHQDHGIAIGGIDVTGLAPIFNAIIQQSFDAILVCDASGIITHWNRGAAELYGYSAAETIGKTPNFLAPDTLGHIAEELTADARDGQALQEFQTVRQRKDGRIIHVSLTISPIIADGGKVLGTVAVSRDISALIRVQGKLLDVERRMNEAQELAHVGSWDWDLALEFPNWSPELCRIYGFDLNHVPCAEDLFERVDLKDRELLHQRIDQARAGENNELEYRLVLPDGETRHVHARHHPTRDENGAVMEVRGVVQDVTQRKHYEAELERLATHDSLTGLPNRRTFDARLELELARSARDSIPLSLAVIDIDHFKRVNDTYGHPAGDHVLTVIGATLGAQVREDELLARVGGEEFAWILHGADTAGAQIAVERARAIIAATDFGEAGRITMSAGISTLADGSAPNDLYRCADLALLDAKRSGRDRVVVGR